MMGLNSEQYSVPADNIEEKLDDADRQAASTTERLSHQTVFANVRKRAKETIRPIKNTTTSA